MSSEIAEQLSLQTRDLISRFEIRAGSFAGRKDLTKLTIPVDKASAEEFARKFLGEGEHVATGIDGSMDFDERLQMMLFYSNATAYSCPVHVGNTLEFALDSAKRDLRLNASAAIPPGKQPPKECTVAHAASAAGPFAARPRRTCPSHWRKEGNRQSSTHCSRISAIRLAGT